MRGCHRPWVGSRAGPADRGGSRWRPPPGAQHGAVPGHEGGHVPRVGAPRWAPRRRASSHSRDDIRPGDPLLPPGRTSYSPGTWLWWTSAAVSAPCQPLGKEDPRAPQPQRHCHLPMPSQWTTGWWLRRAVRRRRVLMWRVCAAEAPPAGRSAGNRPCGAQVYRDGRCGLGRSADPGLSPGRRRAAAGMPCGSAPGQRAAGVGGRCDDVPVSSPSLHRVHRRRLATQRLSSRGLHQRGRRRAAARRACSPRTPRSPRGRSGCGWRRARRMPTCSPSSRPGGWLRTHVLRPTWHLVAPEDLRWMQGVTGPRVEASLAGVNLRLGLTPEVVTTARAVLESLLAGPTPAHPPRGAGGVRRGRAAHGRCSPWRTC